MHYREGEWHEVDWSFCVGQMDAYVAQHADKPVVTNSCGMTHPLTEIVALRNFFDICARHGLVAKCIG